MIIDSPVTGKRESLTQAQFNTYMAQTNGAILKWIVASDTVIKHQEHDQKTHGSWADGVSTTQQLFLNQASKFETYEQFHVAVSLGGLRPRAWHIADKGFELDPNRQPTDRIGSKTQESGLFLGDPEYWQEYATGREIVIEYDVTGMTWTKYPLSDTGAKADFYSDQSGNQGFFVRSQGFGRLKEVARLTLAEAISRSKKQQDEMPDSKAQTKQIWDESRSLLKHAQHNQQTHGNWASGNYENLADWFKDEVKVFASEAEKEAYFMEKLLSQRAKGFTEMAHPEFSGAISFYESRGGFDMNEALRDPQISDDGYMGTVNVLDKAIETAPALSEELIAYRGVKGNGLEFFEKLKVGDTYEDKGFTSTTIDTGVAQQFGGSAPYYDGLVFRMKLPAGTKGIFPSGYHEPMYGWTPDFSEAEFLMPRNSNFKVVAQRGKVWDVELVP